MATEIVEIRYPLYDAEMRALIARVFRAHAGKADVEERLLDAVWEENGAGFRSRNIAASRVCAEDLVRAERGELTPAGRAAIRGYLNEAQDYDESLLELSADDFAAHYDEVCQLAEVERAPKRHKRGLQADVLAPFSRWSANADYEHWSGLPVWSAEEATALSFGKDPRRVDVATLHRYRSVHGSPFCDQFFQRLDKIQRGLISAGMAGQSVAPQWFLEWAPQHEIEMPEELRKKSNQENLREKHDGSKDKIHGKTLHMYYSIFLGIASKYYGFDLTRAPGAYQRGVYSKFARDLKEKHASVHPRSLRKMLREALTWAQNPEQPIIEHARRRQSVRVPVGAPPRGK